MPCDSGFSNPASATLVVSWAGAVLGGAIGAALGFTTRYELAPLKGRRWGYWPDAVGLVLGGLRGVLWREAERCFLSASCAFFVSAATAFWSSLFRFASQPMGSQSPAHAHLPFLPQKHAPAASL